MRRRTPRVAHVRCTLDLPCVVSRRSTKKVRRKRQRQTWISGIARARHIAASMAAGTPAALGCRHDFDARETGMQPEEIAAPGEQPSEETETGARPAAAAKFLLYDDPEVTKIGRRLRCCWRVLAAW